MKWRFEIQAQLDGSEIWHSLVCCCSADAVGEVMRVLAKYTSGRLIRMYPVSVPDNATGEEREAQ